MEDFLFLIISVFLIFLIVHGVNTSLREDEEWHNRCHYEYVDDLGNSGSAFDCHDSFGQLTCDIEEGEENATHVISYEAVCNGDKD